MQLVIYFLDKVAGSLHSSPDGEVSVEGPRAAQIAHTVEHHHEETGLVGDDLLRYVAGRMRGYWTAEEVEEGATDAAQKPTEEV